MRQSANLSFKQLSLQSESFSNRQSEDKKEIDVSIQPNNIVSESINMKLVQSNIGIQKPHQQSPAEQSCYSEE